MKRKYSTGFSLIELMTVVLIVGILAAVATSVYTQSVLKAKRAEARAALTEILQQQERYMTQRNTYLAFGVGATGVPFKTFSGTSADVGSYQIGAEACESATIAECVRLYAVPKHSDPGVGTIALTSAGSRNCTGTVQKECWR